MNVRNNKIRLRKAVTLLELVLAMVMITIVFAAVLPQFAMMGHSWDSKQGVAGASGTANFALTAAEQYRTATIAIAPAAATGTVSGGAGYIRQPTAGSSGTSTFLLTTADDYRTLMIAIAPNDPNRNACCQDNIIP